MSITTQLILPMSLFFMVAYAFGQEAHYDYDRGANFTSYVTRQLIELPGNPTRGVHVRHRD